MHPVLGILLGTICSGGTCSCLGAVLLRRLALPLDRVETFALSLTVGAACFSQLIFVLCSIGLAEPVVFAVVAVLSLFAACRVGSIKKQPTFTPLALRWKWLFGILFAAFGVVYLINAMAPEMSPDGSAYHLPIVMRYLQAHGFEQNSYNFYANISQGVGLLYLPAVSLGGGSAASMVHLLFLFDLPLMMACYGRRFGFPLPALAAGFLIFASPVFGWDGTTAYIDVAAAATLFALFYLLQIWDVEERSGLLIPIGILAGFSYAAKYNAAIGIPYALGFVTWKLWRSRKPFLLPLLTICALTAVFVLPWMIKNTILVHNPFTPFANTLFPNPYVHVSFEQQYRFNLRHYQLTNFLGAPWELAVKGERLQGFAGPVFLLLPLALFSLRWRQGRHLLLAGAMFAVPWCFNVGARFLMPALPPVTLALALALRYPPAVLPALAILHALLSWYSTPFHYFDEYAPRLAAFPIRAALRLEPEDAYLERRSSGYRIDRMIEREVPRGERVFSFEQIPEVWTTHQILVWYMAAENEVLGDILRSPLNPASLPRCGWSFEFAPVRLRAIRAVQTANSPGEMWSISEFHIFKGGQPLRPAPGWHPNADPNPWDVALAFDDLPVTRWRSWEDARPGMFLSVDFGRPELVNEIRLVTTPDASRARIELQGMDPQGKWHTLSARRSSISTGVGDQRRAAIQALLTRGVRYLLVSPGAFGANDFWDNPAEWGIRLIGETDGRRLYRLIGLNDPQMAPEAHSAAAKPPVPPGIYDDPDPRISLHAAWMHDPQFQEADQHTLTYSNVPGATASLTFRGNSVTYTFTRASNRGIAEVSVDDAIRERLDLYSQRTIWRQRVTYAGLGLGEHTIQIRVTGAENPNASNCFVDLDSVIVE